MWRITSFLFLLIWSGCASTQKEITSHRDLISRNYPYTLIGDDYGVLVEEDLAISSCVAEFSPFNFDSITHPYWQCFSTEKAHVECDDGEYDSDEKSLMVVMAIVLYKDGMTHEYLSRRGIRLDVCKEYLREWELLTSGHNHVCISGALANSNQGDKKDERSWIFESYKTKNDCVSYFDSGCDLQVKLKQGCDLAEMTPKNNQ